MDKINKLTLPATIIIASFILGGFYFASQVSKQKSIERQQEIKLQEDRRVEETRAERERIENEASAEADQVRAEKNKADEVFSNSLKCQTLLKDLRQRWNNVVGIYYDKWQNTCIVKYTEKGETQEAPIERMQDKE
ncbi:hypothetical protein HYZ82_01015 [Candidatus Nomurabacteria bacterium]|nr:hypothetical protein [Candidatus Nomurabacteria bacterium]